MIKFRIVVILEKGYWLKRSFWIGVIVYLLVSVVVRQVSTCIS